METTNNTLEQQELTDEQKQELQDWNDLGEDILRQEEDGPSAIMQAIIGTVVVVGGAAVTYLVCSGAVGNLFRKIFSKKKPEEKVEIIDANFKEVETDEKPEDSKEKKETPKK